MRLPLCLHKYSRTMFTDSFSSVFAFFSPYLTSICLVQSYLSYFFLNSRTRWSLSVESNRLGLRQRRGSRSSRLPIISAAKNLFTSRGRHVKKLELRNRKLWIDSPRELAAAFLAFVKIVSVSTTLHPIVAFNNVSQALFT
jgi:hypothetical protein